MHIVLEATETSRAPTASSNRGTLLHQNEACCLLDKRQKGRDIRGLEVQSDLRSLIQDLSFQQRYSAGTGGLSSGISGLKQDINTYLSYMLYIQYITVNNTVSSILVGSLNFTKQTFDLQVKIFTSLHTSSN